MPLYWHDPRRFADYVYAGVKWQRRRGERRWLPFSGARSHSKLTGRDEYEAFGRAIGKTAEEAPAFCETHEGAAWSGCWCLARNGCLPLADAWDFDAITRRVNGPAMEAAGERLRYSDAMLNECAARRPAEGKGAQRASILQEGPHFAGRVWTALDLRCFS
jgi:predicted chitinase